MPRVSAASPFLLSLGVSKSMMSIVFLAGPLSGLIVQPVVGVLSDSCKSSLGRRRPFIIGGCCLTSLSVLMLGWSKEIAGLFATEGTAVHNHLAIACAVVSVYVIDFSVNVIQAMDRSLLVDVVPAAQQPAANAWASRMFGFGAVFGYWIGGLDLIWFTRGWLGDEQLKVLTIFTSIFLCATHAVTVTCVRERILISREDDGQGGGAMRALENIWTTIRTLPRPIQQVFNVQFTGWIGWFPIMFFSSTWVAEIYVKTRFDAATELADAPDDIRADATRAGTRAMLFQSVVSLATSIILPPFVANNDIHASPASSRDAHQPFSRLGKEGWKRFVPDLPLDWLSLPLLWAISNSVFSGLLFFGTWIAGTVWSSSFIIAASGFAWAVTNWAPFAILGDLILRMGSSSSLGPPPGGSSIALHHSTLSAANLHEHEAEQSWDAERELLARDHHDDHDFKTPPPRSMASSPGQRASPPERLNLSSHSADSSPHSALSRSTADSASQPYTPQTARSFYFDAASSTGSGAGGSRSGGAGGGAMSRSTSGHSFATISSSSPQSRSSLDFGGGDDPQSTVRRPTLGGGPGAGAGVGERRRSSQTTTGSRTPTRGSPVRRSRAGSDASSLIAFPPNHGSVGVNLFDNDGLLLLDGAGERGGPHAASGGARGRGGADEWFGADPYAYMPRDGGGGGGGGAASSSTIHLPPRGHVAAFGPPGARNSSESSRSGAGDAGGNDSRVLQIRHSDSFDLSDAERHSFDFVGGGHHRRGSSEDHLGAGMGLNGVDGRRVSTATIVPGTVRPGGGGGFAHQGAPRIMVGGEDESAEEWDAQAEAEGMTGGGGGDQAGVILGCHNIYLVLPQFLVTALSSIIFALFAPHHSVLGHHAPPKNPANSTMSPLGDLAEEDEVRSLAVRAVRVVGGAIGEAFLARRQEQDDVLDEATPGAAGGWDALGMIFRIGGISAAFSAYICFRMWRDRVQAERRLRSANRGYRLTGG
ncbi:hypothetical protein Rhopal_002610-T1 [Rhodotorula paludigena]|uniref:General alpha-glucoside permease n=1 Tax=Rhodotorula paludigena TaxID=86838 RepID=A0AAV5GHK7_9BASI|nr:hypothetical protein Rhopal_002610-T1 [Rhodotorula paludigena]